MAECPSLSPAHQASSCGFKDALLDLTTVACGMWQGDTPCAIGLMSAYHLALEVRGYGERVARKSRGGAQGWRVLADEVSFGRLQDGAGGSELEAAHKGRLGD